MYWIWSTQDEKVTAWPSIVIVVLPQPPWTAVANSTKEDVQSEVHRLAMEDVFQPSIVSIGGDKKIIEETAAYLQLGCRM